ncbi:hypothetical protein [Egicoccus sp. AB-alg2]|uniref:hypothetical protein n=1 Tax=Egicoccus sp. AB-alg2 TaxID=3242693 RepID=UPI00359E97C9
MKSTRTLAGLGVAVLLAGCGLADEPVTVEPPPTTAPTEEPAPSAPGDEEAEAPAPEEVEAPGDDERAEDAPPELPAAPEVAPPYEPSDDETHPNAKQLAAEVVQALTNYGPEDGLRDLASRVADGDDRDALVEAAGPLHHEGAWSRGVVEYPQFGGLTEERTSQMVVVRQTVGLPDGSILEEVRTLDVRLRLRDGAWVFDQLADAGGEPVERPDDLPDEAVAVLDDERIDLPDSARWDIHRGAIVPELLALMSELADEFGPYGVIVLETGHPYHVFGTDRMSDHLRGRAVDVHRVGEELVVEAREEGSTVHRMVEWLYDHDARPIIGSPWALDGFGGRSFTDAVHLDHLHIAVPAPRDRGEVPDEEQA